MAILRMRGRNAAPLSKISAHYNGDRDIRLAHQLSETTEFKSQLPKSITASAYSKNLKQEQAVSPKKKFLHSLSVDSDVQLH